MLCYSTLRYVTLRCYVKPLPICLHYTETTLLSLHDHLTNAISLIKYLAFAFLISLLPLTPLTLLFHRLSTSFGISELPLQWFTFYLPSRTSAVSIPPPLSLPLNLSLSECHKAPLWNLLFFYLYTTPLRTLISLSSISHLFYADDTQLFSFIPKTFPLLSPT